MARKPKTTVPISRPEVIAFLRDAKDNPDDDALRLALAKWLEDRGDSRGEFVRMLVEAVRNGSAYDSPDGFLLKCKALEKEHKADWLGAIPQKSDVSFTRGLVYTRIPTSRFFGPVLRQLAGSEQWEWVEALRIQGEL